MLQPIYEQELDNGAYLSREEEQQLMALAQAGNQSAIGQLVLSQIRNIRLIAGNYSGKGVEVEDLVAEGKQALLNATGTWNAKLGCRLITHAETYVWGAMHDLVRSEYKHYSRIRTSTDASGSEKDWKPSSFSLLVDRKAKKSVANAEEREKRQAIRRILKRLPEEERILICHRYAIDCEPMSPKQLCEELRISKQVLQSRYKKAKRRLRYMMTRDTATVTPTRSVSIPTTRVGQVLARLSRSDRIFFERYTGIGMPNPWPIERLCKYYKTSEEAILQRRAAIRRRLRDISRIIDHSPDSTS